MSFHPSGKKDRDSPYPYLAEICLHCGYRKGLHIINTVDCPQPLGIEDIYEM